ncbi:hypothetical protein HPP92_014933 [Vanilla planifolia]|uniref:At3g06530-like ARM-repeats domain-containing protein n=2 Tax=Vanilla planifolia TaxID=51239 RepID=A0A835QGX7_VANPL|nr:hypothetical protein HPP92_014933 [Vanilla planifolia]
MKDTGLGIPKDAGLSKKEQAGYLYRNIEIIKCDYLSIYNGVYTEKFLKEDWCEVETHGMITIANELNLERFDKSYRRLASQLLHADANALSSKILIFIYWCLLEICNAAAINNWAEDEQLLLLNELFLFFAPSSVGIFKKQLPSVVRSCKAPFQFLAKFFIDEGFAAEVQLESLFSFASICSIYLSDRNYANESAYMSLLMFPSLLIPLSSADKEIRTAAVSCVEGIYMLCQSYDSSQLMNGVHLSL